MRKKVCVVTGTRAEYGLLKPLIEKVNQAEELELQLVATGMHLSPEFGLTYKEIEKDRYPITAKIEMLLSSDTAVGITKSMGVAMLGFADCFELNKPDLVVILGDRYEMLVAASAAMVANIPIAHIHGGELTEGIIDEAIRHSITKMSHIHFTATEEYRKRVIQLGEQPQTVYNVGALGIENIKNMKLLDQRSLEQQLNFTFTSKTIMVTYHPVTLENCSSEKQFKDLLDVIDANTELSVIFTKANSDMDGRIINQMIDAYVNNHSERCVAFTSLGQLRYLSALQYCSAVVGNSSSGIIEVPSFGIPTVNIGNRQKRRLHAKSVINCDNDQAQIEAAVRTALSKDFKKKIMGIKNPYEGEHTSEQILEIMIQTLNSGIDLRKEFYDIREN